MRAIVVVTNIRHVTPEYLENYCASMPDVPKEMMEQFRLGKVMLSVESRNETGQHQVSQMHIVDVPDESAATEAKSE